MAKFEKNGAEGTLTFSITQEELKPALDKAFNRVKTKVNVPGFRKGKVSRTVFNKMFGEESLYEDALNHAFPTAYEAALKEVELLDAVVGQPSITDWKAEKGSDWELTVTTALKPEVTLGDYKDLTVEKQDTEVTDEDVAARLEREQTALAELVLKEDTPAENGDTAVIDFEGFVDGVAFEGGKGENHPLELGSGQFIPGFEEQLVGHKAGEEVEVKVTFPEKYQAEDLAGKDAVFKTTIHEVKAKELPALDDEFAKDVDEEVETLDELKAKIRKELEESKKQAAEDARDELAIRQAVENATIADIPEVMIHDEVHNQMNQFLSQMQQQGINPELYYQLTGTTEEDLHKQYEETAVDRVKTNLVIEAIAKAENFEATDEDIQNEIKDLAEQYNMPVEQVEKFLTTDMLKHDIAMKKAIEVVTSTVKEK
ncbi:trigger factor [Pilibacter termitis]|uniref:Trigger factor n=1 Tax=Pilibacter termitis TaxID=263852 RepID=A0A1T4PTF9_9ENTE|nr:trigger factor [Pilibacter termitis]SJZ94823.1 trigger factor [Pilibacter termitis]